MIFFFTAASSVQANQMEVSSRGYDHLSHNGVGHPLQQGGAMRLLLYRETRGKLHLGVTRGIPYMSQPQRPSQGAAPPRQVGKAAQIEQQRKNERKETHTQSNGHWRGSEMKQTS